MTTQQSNDQPEVAAVTEVDHISKRPVAWWQVILALPPLLLWVLFCVLIAAVAALLRIPGRDAVPRFFHRGCCRLMGLKVEIIGELSRHQPTVFVANHMSLTDIFSLGGWVPGYFIAKSEIAGWPVFGALAKIQNTLFIERNPKRAKEQIRQMREHLRNGQNLIFFPEGTSTNGAGVAPFKSSLFGAVELPEGGVVVQPITLAFVRHRGQPMTQADRNRLAWYDDITFVEHLVSVLGLRGAVLQLHLHAPVRPEQFDCRKALTAHCEQVIARGLREAIGAPEESDDELEAVSV